MIWVENRFLRKLTCRQVRNIFPAYHVPTGLWIGGDAAFYQYFVPNGTDNYIIHNNSLKITIL